MGIEIKHTPYRGKIEPIKDVFIAQTTLYENDLEVILHYTFTALEDDGNKEDMIRTATLIPKALLIIERGDVSHGLDPEDEKIQCVHLYYNGGWTILRCDSNKQADEVYEKIKNWKLSNG